MVIMTGLVTGCHRGQYSGRLLVDPTPMLMTIDARAATARKHCPWDGPLEQVSQELSVPGEQFATFERRLSRWRRNTRLVPLDVIEDMLTRSVLNLHDLYPEAAAELDDDDGRF